MIPFWSSPKRRVYPIRNVAAMQQLEEYLWRKIAKPTQNAQNQPVQCFRQRKIGRQCIFHTMTWFLRVASACASIAMFKPFGVKSSSSIPALISFLFIFCICWEEASSSMFVVGCCFNQNLRAFNRKSGTFCLRPSWPPTRPPSSSPPAGSTNRQPNLRQPPVIRSRCEEELAAVLLCHTPKNSENHQKKRWAFFVERPYGSS